MICCWTSYCLDFSAKFKFTADWLVLLTFLKHLLLYEILLNCQHQRLFKVCAPYCNWWQQNKEIKERGGRWNPVKVFSFSFFNKMSTPLYRCQLHYCNAPSVTSTCNYLLIKQVSQRKRWGQAYPLQVSICLRKCLFIPIGTCTTSITPFPWLSLATEPKAPHATPRSWQWPDLSSLQNPESVDEEWGWPGHREAAPEQESNHEGSCPAPPGAAIPMQTLPAHSKALGTQGRYMHMSIWKRRWGWSPELFTSTMTHRFFFFFNSVFKMKNIPWEVPHLSLRNSSEKPWGGQVASPSLGVLTVHVNMETKMRTYF